MLVLKIYDASQVNLPYLDSEAVRLQEEQLNLLAAAPAAAEAAEAASTRTLMANTC